MMEINKLLDALKQNGQDTAALLEERERLQNKIDTDEQRDEVVRGFEKEIEGIDLKLKWAGEERDKLLGEVRDARELA